MTLDNTTITQQLLRGVLLVLLLLCPLAAYSTGQAADKLLASTLQQSVKPASHRLPQPPIPSVFTA